MKQIKNKTGGYNMNPIAQNREALITIKDVTKIYQLGDYEVQALRGVSLELYIGDFVAIMGPSGSGKSTLMNVLGALDTPTSGSYMLAGTDVSQLSDDDLADIRNSQIGFVFQNFNLLARTPALQQVELPLVYAGKSGRSELAQEALELVGLGDRIHHRPSELSGGQQQRVAIARALVNEPAIILADEPTGNLESTSGVEIMQVLQQLNQENGITIICVTHDPWIARHCHRVIRLSDGLVVGDEIVEDPLVAGQTERPSEVMLG
jgi:putative ABC transport system ATP-binding protein